MTYDPSQPEPYAISLTRPDDPWPATDSFGLRFDGPAALTIGTSRHQLSADGRTLTVSDTGFGNVLDGLALNGTATALAGRYRDPLRPCRRASCGRGVPGLRRGAFGLRGVASVPKSGGIRLDQPLTLGHTKDLMVPGQTKRGRVKREYGEV